MPQLQRRARGGLFGRKRRARRKWGAAGHQREQEVVAAPINSVRPFFVVPRRDAAAARPVSAGRARRKASRARRGGKSKQQRGDNVTATERCEKGSETMNAGNGAAWDGAGGAERGASGEERGRRRAQSKTKLARSAPGRRETARGPRASCGAGDPPGHSKSGIAGTARRVSGPGEARPRPWRTDIFGVTAISSFAEAAHGRPVVL